MINFKIVVNLVISKNKVFFLKTICKHKEYTFTISRCFEVSRKGKRLEKRFVEYKGNISSSIFTYDSYDLYLYQTAYHKWVRMCKMNR